ncbi:hypothetical protein QYF61_019122 [Mycteria americana]|uniref:Uncharacterized protein n=1 Tax=Mycteria americana TaxID=33587 RepID=A0AAN7S412_MYCAM|nr:hypothetical protein QYF61_019122 [Mycteria americana]
MAPDGMPQKELKVLANVIARVTSILFERSQPSGETPNDWKKANIANITPIFKKNKNNLGKYKIMGQILLKDMSKHMEDKKVSGNSQHRLTKGKLHLINLIHTVLIQKATDTG